ncbi:hypothetical protein ACE1SV_06080 [Streptomyces sp. E-15]
MVGWLLVATASPRLASHVGAVLLLLTPLGAVVLGERPTALQLAGCALILVSAYRASARGPGADRGARRSGAARRPGVARHRGAGRRPGGGHRHHRNAGSPPSPRR